MFRRFAKVCYSTFRHYINRRKAENQQGNLFKSIESKFVKHRWLQISSPLSPYNAPQKQGGGVLSVDNTLRKTGIWESQVALDFMQSCFPLTLRQPGRKQ